MALDKFIPVLCMLLGIMQPSIAVDPECNYEQVVKPGVTYYVYNPSYPNFYKGRHHCAWRASSQTRLRLKCDVFNIMATPNCSGDALTIQVEDSIEYRLCGLTSFVVESITEEMTIKFQSHHNTYGGRFKCELRAIEDNCSCGWKNPSRIVGGVETGVNEFPMMAGLVDLNLQYIFCGATIITERHVLTAAHCLANNRIKVNELAIILGEHDVTTGTDTNVTKLYLVDYIKIHPKYTTAKFADIAIVRSASKFQFSMRVGPVCLPFYYTQESFEHKMVTVLGWGTLNIGGAKSNTLMKVNLNVINLNKCSEYYNITSRSLCTYAKGKDACQFDSGGPILWQNPESQRMMLVGIVSYGRLCADEDPGVNTRVTSYLDFIKETTSGYDYCKVW